MNIFHTELHSHAKLWIKNYSGYILNEVPKYVVIAFNYYRNVSYIRTAGMSASKAIRKPFPIGTESI